MDLIKLHNYDDDVKSVEDQSYQPFNSSDLNTDTDDDDYYTIGAMRRI